MPRPDPRLLPQASFWNARWHPRDGCAHEDDGAWPHKATVEGTSLAGEYRCFYCDAEWRVGHYDVNISDYI